MPASQKPPLAKRGPVPWASRGCSQVAGQQGSSAGALGKFRWLAESGSCDCMSLLFTRAPPALRSQRPPSSPSREPCLQSQQNAAHPPHLQSPRRFLLTRLSVNRLHDLFIRQTLPELVEMGVPYKTRGIWASALFEVSHGGGWLSSLCLIELVAYFCSCLGSRNAVLQPSCS